MARSVKTHRFRGVRYHIGVDDPYIGWCDNPSKRKNDSEYPAIRLPGGLPFGNKKGARLGLICLLHEVRHAQDYKLSETIVDREAQEIARLLWRLGYRRVK